MVDTQLLIDEIEASGLKKGFIAGEMGLTTQGLAKKIKTGRFTTDEAYDLCNIIRIVSEEKRNRIFFAPNVDKNGNIAKKK